MLIFIYIFLFFIFINIFEMIIINCVYFKDISLFRDIILTKKNRKKLDDFYLRK